MQTRQQQVTRTGSYNYLLFLPDAYETQDKWPTILFLHGAGEKGSNLEYVKRHGVPRIVEEQADFPFIAVSPQCPQGSRLNTLLDEVESSYRVDPDRVYLTGISMGSFGTWRLAAAQPHRFAAIAPICGGGETTEACNLKDIPVWAFHGARDLRFAAALRYRIVPLSASQEMVEALKACGGNVKFTVYPEAEHDSWTQTYNNPELFDWFRQHRRERVAR